ncbi:hypothetical protein N9O57_01365 [bacterium]|nr:hypothetical protein [bacterium]
MSEDIITHKTGLSGEDEVIIKFQMISLVKKNIEEYEKKCAELIFKIENIRRFPKAHMITEKLDDPYLNLKIIKIEIENHSRDLHHRETVDAMSVEDLTLIKKSLKLMRYNMDLISVLLEYVEKEFKSKLRRPINVCIGVLCIALGLFFYIYFN